jgi:hypothetical protein
MINSHLKNIGWKIATIIIDISKAFDLVPHDRLLTKSAALGVDSRVVVWIWEFCLGCTQRVRVGGPSNRGSQNNVRVPQGSVLSPLLLVKY